MREKTPKRRGLWPRELLRRAEQATAAALVAAALLAMAAYGWYRSGLRGRWIDVDRTPPTTIQFAVDINTADWPELSQLPGVGETLARRIVEHRAEHGPFMDLEDLQNVRGIGPKTMDRLRPYLLPMPDAEAVAGGEVSEPNS